MAPNHVSLMEDSTCTFTSISDLNHSEEDILHIGWNQLELETRINSLSVKSPDANLIEYATTIFHHSIQRYELVLAI